MSKEQTGDQVYTEEDLSDLRGYVQYLVDELDRLGYIDEGFFCFPDGTLWSTTKLQELGSVAYE